MKAAVIHAIGQPPRYEDFPEPTAADGEVRVTVRAAGLHPVVRAMASGSSLCKCKPLTSDPRRRRCWLSRRWHAGLLRFDSTPIRNHGRVCRRSS